MIEKKYKLSHYNVFFERKGNSYLWNTFSGALIKVNESGKAYIDSFNGCESDDNYFKILKNNGCIVHTRFDELGKVLIEEKTLMVNPAPERFHYTIAPTMSCNYNCNYCFEDGYMNRKKMSDDTQNLVCQYIFRQILRNKNLKQLTIRWFGGEPLLHMDAIQYISCQLDSLCREHDIKYDAGIVTNGRFLTRKNAILLRECKVEYVQLSVDGMSERYIKMKHATPRDFDATIENIVAASDILPITVRINVSDDIEDAIRLTHYLLGDYKLDGKIKIYVAQIRRYGDSSTTISGKKEHAQFLNLQQKYMKLFAENGNYKAESFARVIPRRRCTTCFSVCYTNPCIGPEGELYRCEHDFGKNERIVGTVEAGRFYSFPDREYFEFEHFSECKKCSFLPICLGGCMNNTKAGVLDIECEQFKERMIDMLMFNA